MREDCNQEDGRCECKPGVYGIKCTECPVDKELTPDGCVSIIEQQKQMENLCSSLNCNHPGAYCSIEEGQARCICDTISCENDNKVVCGEDGQTYASECDLIKFSCSKQMEIRVAYEGQCRQGLNFFFAQWFCNNKSLYWELTKIWIFIVTFQTKKISILNLILKFKFLLMSQIIWIDIDYILINRSSLLI